MRHVDKIFPADSIYRIIKQIKVTAAHLHGSRKKIILDNDTKYAIRMKNHRFFLKYENRLLKSADRNRV